MLWVSLLLGFVEGVTEFLPISSTGHLILASEIVGFDGALAELFTVFIQLGAILAVSWEYRVKLLGVALDLPRSAAARAFAGKLLLAFVPSGIVGLAVHDFMKKSLWHPIPVAAALLGGGLAILVVERWHRARFGDAHQSGDGVDAIGWAAAFKIGLAQCLALWPGFSRSAATILGGLGVGLDRRTATEFSFFLAIPTMFAASTVELASSWDAVRPSELAWLGLSLAVSFFVAWASIRWLLRYVSTHTFTPFAWYRIVLGAVILLVGF